MRPTTARRLHRAALIAAALVLGAHDPRPAAADGLPKIRSVNPAGTPRNTTVDVTIEGSNLAPLEDASTNVPDVSVVILTGGNDHKVQLRLTVPDSVPAGTITLRLKTKGGLATWDRFAIRARNPVLSKVVPGRFKRGGEYDATATGLFLAFTGYETKVTTEPPVTVAVKGKATEKSLGLHFVVPAAAPVGMHTLTVETTDGKASVPFEVAFSPPVVASVAPAAVVQGTTAELTLSGDALGQTGAVVLAAPDPGLRVAPSGAPDAKAVKVQVIATADAVCGPRLLVVQTPDGLATATFSVTATPPKTLRVKPETFLRGAATDLTLTGEGLPKDVEPRLVPPDPSVKLERAPSGGWRATVAADAKPGPRTVVVATRGGASATTVHVATRGPVVAGTVPGEVAPGAEADLAFEGQDLAGAELALLAPEDGVTASPVAGRPGSLHVKVAADARPGPRHVLLTTPDGLAAARFEVKGAAGAAPSVSSASPGRLPRGSTTRVVLTGANLKAGGGADPTLSVTDGKGGSFPVKLVEGAPGRLVLDASPALETPARGYALVVTTPEGSAATALQVDPTLPSVASVTPASAVRPGKVEVAVEGHGLLPVADRKPKLALVPAVGGGGPVPGEVVSAGPDRVVARFAIEPAAAPGPWLLVVDTPEGGAAAPFTVEAAPPVVASMTPTRMGTPAVVDVTLAGKNLVQPNGSAPRVQVTRLGSASSVTASVVSSTPDALVLRLTTAAGSTPGPHVVVVQTADGVSAAVLEVSDAKPPRVVSIEPNAAGKGESLFARVRGSALTGVVGVAFSGKGVTAAVQPGSTDDVLNLKVTVEPDAAPGPRTFTVEGPGGVAADPAQVFTVK
jgi:hypothetical protein